MGNKMDKSINFRRRSFLTLVAGLALSLGGCLEFSHSLVDTPAPNDRRLLGYWHADLDDNPAEFFFEEANPHMLHLRLLDVKSCKLEFYQVTRTEIDGRDFMHVVEIKNGEAARSSDMTQPTAYEIYEDKQFIVYLANGGAFRAAVERGELGGTVSRALVKVSASTAELRRFVAAHPETVSEKFLTATRGKLSPPTACKLGG
jgi:hypothetical protein